MLEIVFRDTQNIIFAIFLKKLLFKKMIIYFIDNPRMILLIKFCIPSIKIRNLQ